MLFQVGKQGLVADFGFGGALRKRGQVFLVFAHQQFDGLVHQLRGRPATALVYGRGNLRAGFDQIVAAARRYGVSGSDDGGT